jgi:hypothetical protein
MLLNTRGSGSLFLSALLLLSGASRVVVGGRVLRPVMETCEMPDLLGRSHERNDSDLSTASSEQGLNSKETRSQRGRPRRQREEKRGHVAPKLSLSR